MRRQADADGQARLTEAQREQADGLTAKKSHRSTREMGFFCVFVVFVQTHANADGCSESNEVFIIDRLLITNGEGSKQLETARRRLSSSLVPGQGSVLLIGFFILTIFKAQRRRFSVCVSSLCGLLFFFLSTHFSSLSFSSVLKVP